MISRVPSEMSVPGTLFQSLRIEGYAIVSVDGMIADRKGRMPDALRIDADQRFFAAGLDVARLHSGDLSVYSALAEQLRRLKRRAIPYTLTPGVPAFASAAAALGCELTVPEVAQSVVLTRMPGRASRMPQAEQLASFATTRATLAIHLAISALDKIVAELTPFYGADCPAAVVVRASWPDERVLRGTLGDICASVAAAPIEHTALVLVGRALGAENFRESALYDAGYQRRFRAGDGA